MMTVRHTGYEILDANGNTYATVDHAGDEISVLFGSRVTTDQEIEWLPTVGAPPCFEIASAMVKLANDEYGPGSVHPCMPGQREHMFRWDHIEPNDDGALVCRKCGTVMTVHAGRYV